MRRRCYSLRRMRNLLRLVFSLAVLGALGVAQENQPYKIAVIGLVHLHVLGHLPRMLEGKSVKLVGIAEPNAELTASVKKSVEAGGKVTIPDSLLFTDYKKMLDETKPDIVWAFVENNRHLEIAKVCAPRHINLIYEKPLASTYEDAKEIRRLAGEYHIRVMTNYQMAWWPTNYTEKAAVDRGDVGTVFRLHGIVGHGFGFAKDPGAKFFVDWLTDPVKNGAGALMDFGCYNVLWSLWYLGMPKTIYATAEHLRPELFPKVEDNAVLVLTYPNATGIFEASWDLPRGFQDLEIFGRPDGKEPGSIHMNAREVDLQVGRDKRQVPVTPLAPQESEPIAYMVSRMKENKPVEGLTAMDINVRVIRLIELAKESIRTGKAVNVTE